MGTKRNVNAIRGSGSYSQEAAVFEPMYDEEVKFFPNQIGLFIQVNKDRM